MRLTLRARSWVRGLGGAVLILVVLVLAAAAAALVWKAPWAGRRPRMLLPNRGCQVKQFALYDVQGRLHTALEWRGRKGAVLFFLEPECPVVSGYAPEMRRLAECYRIRG